jgi:PhnB protein
MATLNPYLNFDGKTEEAFNFYRSVFGGEFAMLQRMKDIPSDVPSHGAAGDQIMHVALPIGQGSVLMGSDRPAAFGPGTRGDNFYITIHAASEDEARKLFDGLSEGGQVTMPLQNAFWGALFGMFVDRYGVQWMVSYDHNRH